jgi:hypothetical protein
VFELHQKHDPLSTIKNVILLLMSLSKFGIFSNGLSRRADNCCVGTSVISTTSEEEDVETLIACFTSHFHHHKILFRAVAGCLVSLVGSTVMVLQQSLQVGGPYTVSLHLSFARQKAMVFKRCVSWVTHISFVFLLHLVLRKWQPPPPPLVALPLLHCSSHRNQDS